jgi:hypothetical protein
MHPSPPDQAMRSDGLVMIFGSLLWTRPYFPTRHERATLVKQALPRWAIASGNTAGWVWTGMGRPEPWTILRPSRPAISPLERTQWRARALNSAHHRVVVLSGLSLLTQTDTAREIALGEGPIDECAAQIHCLSRCSTAELPHRFHDRRSSATEQAHAAAVVGRLGQLRELYPDITR